MTDFLHVFVHQREAFMTSALVLGALFFLCCMLLFLGVKEQSGKSAVHFITHGINAFDVSCSVANILVHHHLPNMQETRQTCCVIFLQCRIRFCIKDGFLFLRGSGRADWPAQVVPERSEDADWPRLLSAPGPGLPLLITRLPGWGIYSEHNRHQQKVAVSKVICPGAAHKCLLS